MILDDILATLDYNVRVANIVQGTVMTAAVSRCLGLSTTIPDSSNCETTAPVSGAGTLTDKGARTVAEMVKSSRAPEASIGMAAVNSLLAVDANKCRTLNARDVIAERGRNKKVAMIGHFPFADQIRPLVGELWIIEQKPMPGDFSAADAVRLLPQADVVAITGTAFINHTIDGLLKLCRSAYVIVLGPSTPLSPILFDYGVSVISGIIADEPETVLRYVSQGAAFRQLQGIRLVTMERDNR